MRAPEFWRQDGLWPRLLSPLGLAFDLAGRLRRALAKRVEVNATVICVGNLVAGGAGKTPVVLAVLKLLKARGVPVQALTRGHGGRLPGPLHVDPSRHEAGQVGDEALLLARAAPTWVARDRVAGAQAALASGAKVIVMDDGHQNPYLARHLSLLVIDGDYGLGNARVMPAGPLREAAARGLARADAAIILGGDTWGVEDYLSGRLKILRASLGPLDGAPELQGRRVYGFAGIGHPEKFFATLETMGADLIERRSFPDHHPFSAREIEDILAHAASSEALVVTTEKDLVRVPLDLRAKVTAVPVAVTWQDQEAVESLIARALGPGHSDRREAI